MAKNVYDPSKFTPDNIRNVCILAHVDHGKTSVADCLLALNGLVNRRSIGKVKYLDNRSDEQERHITMKSSAISIVDVIAKVEGGVDEPVPIIMNLVDTPGHIDFSTEVTAAVRICDGALIIVDVVEGVCAQTKVAIKQAYDEQLKMILIVNKIDRLLLDLKQDAKEIAQSILRIVEDCNVYLSGLYHLDLSTNPELGKAYCEKPGLLFNPEIGNVIFASTIDGWGFTLRHIARTYKNVVKMESEDSMTSKLWNFDYYIGSKDKLVKKGAIEAGRACMFVQLVTSMMYFVYSNLVTRQRLDIVEDIIKKLYLTSMPPHWLYRDGRTKLRCIMETWQPLAKTIVLQSFLIFPSPANMDEERINYLINSERYLDCEELSSRMDKVLTAFKECSANGPPIAYISKLLVRSKESTGAGKAPIVYPQDKPGPSGSSTQPPAGDTTKSEEVAQEEDSAVKGFREEPSNVDIIALIRIFSGIIHEGQQLYLLHPDYNPVQFLLSDHKESYLETCETAKKITVTGVHVLLGPDQHSVSAMGAGYICGISGVSNILWRTGTLCTSLYNAPIIEQPGLQPIVSNVLTVVDVNELPQLRNGLRLLQQSDSCVKAILNEAGEYMVLSAGDVHLQKCMEDLLNVFAKVDFEISLPIYSLRESVEPEAVKIFASVLLSPSGTYSITIDITVMSIPKEIVELIQAQYVTLKTVQDQQVPSMVDLRGRHDRNALREPEAKVFKSETTNTIVSRLKTRLNEAFVNHTKWNCTTNNIWKIGPVKENVNLLINNVPDYVCNIFSTPDECDSRIFVENYIVNAFNMCCNAGPLCEEPLMNCAFVVKNLTVSDQVDDLIAVDAQQANSLTQQFRATFRDAMEQNNVVLMEPILASYIQTDMKGIGKLYSEVHKRCGKITDHLTLVEQQKNFTVKATIPAVKSEGFANKVRKISHGGANPTLSFSHFEVVAAEPTDSDDETEKKDNFSRVQNLIREVRRRKGLSVEDDQVVVHAEKQRTLKK